MALVLALAAVRLIVALGDLPDAKCDVVIAALIALGTAALVIPPAATVTVLMLALIILVVALALCARRGQAASH